MANLPVSIVVKKSYIQFIVIVILIFTSSCSKQLQGGWIEAGTVKIESGLMLVSDPLYLPDVQFDLAVQIDQIPPGNYSVELLESDLGEWGKRIVRARIIFKEDPTTDRELLGYFAVDSASAVVLDPINLHNEWIEVGPQRDGFIIGTNKDIIAERLETEGFILGEQDDWSIKIDQPISEEDEKHIQSLIEKENLDGWLMIQTGNSYDQLVELLANVSSWGSLPFKNGDPGFAVGFTSGMGDGYYPVYGLYNAESLIGIEIELLEE